VDLAIVGIRLFGGTPTTSVAVPDPSATPVCVRHLAGYGFLVPEPLEGRGVSLYLVPDNPLYGLVGKL